MNQHHTNPYIAEAAHKTRMLIAMQRDRLVGRQRRRYSPKRQAIIDQLGDQYRQVYQVQIDTQPPETSDGIS